MVLVHGELINYQQANPQKMGLNRPKNGTTITRLEIKMFFIQNDTDSFNYFNKIT